MGWLVALGLALVALVPSSAAAAKKARCQSSGVLGALGESQPPAELEGSLEAPVLAQFGIFRRAQAPGDVLPPVNPAAEVIGHSLSGYYPSEIRQIAALANGARFYVVPGLPRAITVPRSECLPKALRELLEKERAKDAEPRYCIIATGLKQELGTEGCPPFSEVAASGPVFNLFGGEGPQALLVPDGVAFVRVVGPGTRTVTIAVAENAYVYTPPATLEKEEAALFHKLFKPPKVKHPTKAQRRWTERKAFRAFEEVALRTRPSRVEWLGATGQVVKSTKRPPGLGGGPLATLFAALLSGS